MISDTIGISAATQEEKSTEPVKSIDIFTYNKAHSNIQTDRSKETVTESPPMGMNMSGRIKTGKKGRRSKAVTSRSLRTAALKNIVSFEIKKNPIEINNHKKNSFEMLVVSAASSQNPLKAKAVSTVITNTATRDALNSRLAEKTALT